MRDERMFMGRLSYVVVYFGLIAMICFVDAFQYAAIEFRHPVCVLIKQKDV